MESPTDPSQDHTTYAIERVTATLGGATGATALSGMSGIRMESSHPFSEPEVPPNIHDLIEGGLTEADMPGGATRKRYIAGHPGLLERYAEGTDVDNAKEAISTLQALGLPITPTAIVEHGGEPHLITKVVDGRQLDELLPNASPELLTAVDEAWAKLTNALMTAYQTGRDWPGDIEGPHQWMLGTLSGDTNPRLWIVDLPVNTDNLRPGDLYGYQVFNLLNALYDIEQLSGTRMTDTRLALANAIALCPDTAYNGDAFRNAAYYCLLHNLDPHVLDNDPEFLPSMRRKQ